MANQFRMLSIPYPGNRAKVGPEGSAPRQTNNAPALWVWTWIDQMLASNRIELPTPGSSVTPKP